MDDGEGTAPPVPTVAPVALKLPPFWPADPQIWFAQVEAQFQTRGIKTQKTKFDHVVASLSPEFATEVRNLVLSPPDENPYDALCAQLIKRMAASEQQRLQQLFHTEELGDHKLTQLLRRMQQLLGEKSGTVDGSFLCELFLQHLPSNVRMVLASSLDTLDIEGLATLADRIMEVAPVAPTVNAISPGQSPDLLSELSQLRAEVATLRKMLHPPDRHHRRSTTPRCRSTSPQPSPDLCWYHSCFGDAARKCRPPCSKAGNTPASH